MSRPLYSPWIRDRLQYLFASDPRYEHSYYGPINAVLTELFPSQKHHLVKPQGAIRPSFVVESSTVLPPGTPRHADAVRSSLRMAQRGQDQPGAASLHAMKLSTDSTGDVTVSREMGGRENVKFPDFVIVKVLQDCDKIFAIVEVKRLPDTESQDVTQIKSYMDAILSKNHADGFVGMLCIGQRARVWVKDGTHMREIGEIETGSDKFCKLLIKARDSC